LITDASSGIGKEFAFQGLRIKSEVPSMPALLNAVKSTFEAIGQANLRIATKTVPLSEVENHWNAPGKPRLVFTLG
jgi:ABC-type molybdate transport system permease subunit